MRRQAPVARSFVSETRAKMNATLVFLVLCVAGSAVGYNVRREAPYNNGYNDPYYSRAVNTYQYQEPSQKLFWGEPGSNQVGGTGLWATLTNKFPILNSMFGRMELPIEYGPPQSGLSTQYGVPNQYQFQPQYQVPQVDQFYQQPQQQFRQRFVPSARDVGLTDDAVIVTPPFVPAFAPQPAPAPAPIPAPLPQPIPAPAPEQGYTYNKPQYRLELPHK